MTTITPQGNIYEAKPQFFDNNGDPLNAGKVYFYIVATTTPKNTYSDYNLATPNANPVVLDSAGRASIYGSGLFRQIVKDSLDNTISDQVVGFNDLTVSEEIQRYGGTSGGSANSQTLTPSTPITAYSTGVIWLFQAGFTNTGQMTIAISGLSALAVKTRAGFRVNAGVVKSGRWYEVVYNGTDLTLLTPAGAQDFLWEQTAAGSAAIDFTGLDGSYPAYVVEFDGVQPQTDTAVFRSRISVAAAFQTANYRTDEIAGSGGAVTETTTPAGTEFQIAPDTDTGVAEVVTSGQLRIDNPAGTTFYKILRWTSYSRRNTGPYYYLVVSAGQYEGSVSAIDGLRFYYSSGNVQVGTFRLYGINNG